MIIRVVFNDNTCGMIPVTMLQLGIECRKIKMFYRSSEGRWVTVGQDPIRQQKQIACAGYERRSY